MNHEKLLLKNSFPKNNKENNFVNNPGARTTRCTRFQKYILTIYASSTLLMPSTDHLCTILSLSIVRVRRKIFFILSRAAYKFSNFCRIILTVNIPMADKEKRLRKILSRLGLKGRLKLVASLDEAHLVIVEDKRCASRTKLIGKDSWLIMIERGYTFPEEDVYYVISPNPRDKKNIEQKYLTYAFACIQTKLT